MNKIYKVIWNKTTQTFVVVSELATSQNKAASSVDNVVIKQENRISAFLFKLKATMIASLVALLPMAASATLIITNNDNSGYAFNNNPANPANQLGGDRAFNYNNPGNLSYTNPNVARVGSNLYSPDEAVTGVAIGRNSNVVTTGGATVSGIAIGDYSRAVGGLAFALGGYSQATNVGATAIGTSALASGFNSLSMMRQAAATNDYAMAIGTVAWASGKGSLAMGQSSTATGNQSIAIGSADVSPSTAANGVSVASYDNTTNTKATADFAVAVGAQSKATAQSALAIGTKSTASAASATAISSNATASGGNSLALGVFSQAAATAAIAIGSGAQALGNSTVAIGNAAGVNAAPNTRYIHNVAVGTNAGQNVPGQYNVALGYQAGSNMTTGSDTVKNVVIIPQDNIAIGRDAGSNLSARAEQTNDGLGGTYAIQNPALYNVAIGLSAGSNLSGSANVALGRNAGSGINGWRNSALGDDAGARVTGEANTAVGSISGNDVSGNSNVALGGNSGSTVTGNNNVALGGAGQRVTGNKNFSTGNGSGNDVIGNSNISMNGKGTITNGHNNVAIGEGAGGTLIGTESAPNSNNIAIGSGAGAASSRSLGSNIAIGYEAGKTVNGAEQTSAFTIALGQSTKVSGSDAVALALNAQANGAHAMALGTNTKATGDSAVALGMMANANGNNATALGRQANATVANALAVGYLATASATRAAALGYQAQATAANATSLGNEARATAARSIALGNTSAASGISSIAQGDAAIASGANAVAIGKGAQATAEDSIAIGTGNVVSGKGSGALGDPSYITGAGTYTVGNDNGTQAAPIAADNAGAFGNGNLMGADADGSRIIGNQNNVQQANTFVVGNNVTTSQANSVILGNASADRAATAETSATINGITYGTFAGVGSAANGVVSVGAVGAERQIINVAAGQISATSTDAINGSQLYTVAEVAAKGWNIQANGGTSAKVAPGDTVNFINGTGTTATVATANGISNVSYSVNKSDLTVADNGTVSAQTDGDNFATAADVAEAINSANKTTVVEAGNNVTVNDPVVNGTVTTYTVNAEKATVSAAADSGLSAVAGAASATGVTDYAISLSQTSKQSLEKADSALQTVVTQIDGATVKTLKQDDNSANFITGDNITLTADSGGIKVATKQDVTFNNVTTNSLTAGPVSINNGGINAGDTVISNVASGGDVTSNAANIGDVQTAAAAAKSEVKAGTNVASVTSETGETKQTIYTVNADGASVSAAEGSAVSVAKGEKNSSTNVTDYALDLTQNTKDDIKKGVDAKEAVDGKGLTFTGDSGNTDEKLLGSEVAIKGDENITTTATANEVKIALNKALKVDSVTAGNTTLNNDGVTITGGTNNVSLTNTGLNNGGNQITNVASGGDVTSNAANIGDVQTAAAAAKSEVKAGTNVASVDESKGDNNQTVYTVNANGAKTSAGSSAVTVAAGTSDTNNVTDYKVDLSDNSKESLAKADSALQSWTAQVNGANAKTVDQTNNSVNFVNGDNIVVSNENGDIKVSTAKEVTFDSVTINNGGSVTEGSKSAVNGGDVYTAIQNTESQFKGDNDTLIKRKPAEVLSITGGATGETTANNIKTVGNADGSIAIELAKNLTGLSSIATETIKVGDTVEISKDGINAGNTAISNVASGGNVDSNAANIGDVKNAAAAAKSEVAAGTNVSSVTTATGANDQTIYTVNADGASVSAANESAVSVVKAEKDSTTNITDYALDLTQTTKDNIQKGVDAKSAVDSKGLTFTGDNGSTDEKLLGSKVAINGDDNITTTATVDSVKIGLNKNLTVDSVVAGNTTINTDGITITGGTNNVSLTNTGLNNGGNSITNVASGGDVDSNAANIGDVKTAAAAAKSEVKAGTNVVSVDESKGADNQTVYTVNAKGTTASAGSSAVTVEPDTSDVNNVTDYKVDLSEASKASLAKADTALQTVVTQIDGTEVKTLTKDSNSANFVTGDNIELTADNGGIKIATAKEVVFDKVSVGNTVINGDGLSINNGPSITSTGIDVAGNKISNVAAGENDTDAVNMSQLNQVAANQKVAKVIAGNNTKVTAEVDDNTTTYTVNAEKATVTGSTAIVATASDKGNDVTDYALDLSQATKDDIQKGVDAKETVDSKGLTFTGDSGSSDEKLLGSQVAVNGDENITTTADKNGVKVKLNKDLTGLNSVSANTVNAGSVVVGDANNSTTLTGTANGLDVGGDKITNVAAGDVNENSTDAVNGSQLHTTNTNVANNTKNIAQNTAEIEKGINFGDGATSTQYQLGDTINVKGDSNVTSTTTADGVQLALAKNINLDSVTAGNTVLNDAGITINGGANSPVSLTNNGLNNGGNQITNVASGGDVDSNAANIGDVKNAAAAAKSEVAAGTNVSSVTTATGANDQTIYTVNADGASVSAANESAVSVVKAEKDSTTNITDYALDLTQATKDDIQKGVDAKSAVDSKGLTFTGDNGSTDEKLLGSKVAINGDDNITTTATADSVKIGLNKNLTVDSVVAGNTTINTDGITITGGTNNVSLTNTGLNNGGNAITNVAAGVNDSDAVNVAQLKEVRTTAAAHSTVVAGDNVTVTTDTNADGGVEYNVAVPNAVVYDNDAHDSITLGGTSASEPVSLTNVKAGELNATSTDAVNGSQLHATNQNVAANSANIAQNTADIATNAANIVKGINFGDGNSSNNFALGATINVKGDNNIISTTTADGVQLGLSNNVTIGTAKPVTINGDSGTIGGLSNTSWNADNITSGQAATEDQLKAVSNIANQGFNLTSSASDGEVSGSSVEQVAPGETVTIDAGKNIAVTQNGNQISIATLNNLTVDSVVAGNSVLNNTGLTINDGTNGTVSLTNAGLNNGGNAITNVAAGVNDSDAVNVAQLNDVKKAAAAAATEITQGDNIVVTESKGKDGQTIYNVATAKDLNIDSVTAGNTVLNQNGVTVSDKVALNKDGLRVGDVSISTTGINAGGNKISGVAEGDISATSTDAVNGSQLYKIQQQAQAQSSVVAGDNIEVTTATNANGGVEYSVATAKVVSFDKTTVGTVVTDSNTNKISGLANGNISATSSDAVNGSQLYNNAKAVAATLGGGSAVDVNGNITAPTYTVTDGNPSSGNSVTVHTVGAAISNLTAGVQKPLTFETDSGSYVARLGSTIGIKGDGNNISTSADSNGNITVKMSDTPNFTSIKTGNTTVGNNGVTVTGGDNGTVSLTSNGLNNGGNRITNVAPGVEGTDAVNVNQLSAVSNTINNRINKVDNRASAGTASAMAAAGLPQAYLPGHSMVAVAGGTHRGENAMALGVSRISDNGKVIVKLTGATNSEKDTSASIGVGYQW